KSLRLHDRGLRDTHPDRRRRQAGPLRARRGARPGARVVRGKPLLEIVDLWVTYWGGSLLGLGGKPFHAVKGANLSIHAGQTLGLVGESGSGKSSIANTVLGLVPASSGSIRFGDVDLTSLGARYPSAVRNQIQAVFQDPYSSLNPSMTVEDIV